MKGKNPKSVLFKFFHYTAAAFLAAEKAFFFPALLHLRLI